MKNAWQIGYISFQLMKEYPDTAYLNILQTYHRRRFYNFNGNRRDGFTGFVTDRADREDFINALVVQQNAQSAELLDTMLSRLHSFPCMPDKESIEDEIVEAIWAHPAIAYKGLREKIKPRAKPILMDSFPIELDRHNDSLYMDMSVENIRWFP